MPRQRTSQDSTESSAQQPKQRRRRTEITRAIKAVEAQRQILGDSAPEVLRIATLQVVARRLDEIKTLLTAAGLTAIVTPQAISSNAPPPPSEPACAICGRRPVIYRAKKARTANPPWYCQDHAQWAAQQDGEDIRSEKVGMKELAQPAPQPAPPKPQVAPPSDNGSPGVTIKDALAGLQGQRPIN